MKYFTDGNPRTIADLQNVAPDIAKKLEKFASEYGDLKLIVSENEDTHVLQAENVASLHAEYFVFEWDEKYKVWVEVDPK